MQQMGERKRRSRGTGRVRIEDVASAAGVSAQTVSRFLRDPGQVSAGVATRVREAVEANGYVPNRVAGALASNRSHIVAILVPTIANPIHALPVQALTDALRPAGYQVLVGATGYDPLTEEELVGAFLGRRVDGVVLTGTALTERTRRILQHAGIPVVQLWELPRDPVDMAVGFDNEASGAAMARHLHGRGYRRLAVLSHAAAGDTRSAARALGFEREARRLGLPEPFRHDYETPTDMGQGAALLASLRGRVEPPDAVFCVGAPVAVGMILAAPGAGVAIPGDLAICAFGDNDLAPLVSPALTTVRVPRDRLGRCAAEMLLARFAEQPMDSTVVDVGFDLVVREST